MVTRDPALTAPPPEPEPLPEAPDPFGPLAGAGLGVGLGMSLDDTISALPRDDEGETPVPNPIRAGLGAPTSLLNVGKSPDIGKLRADRRRITADKAYRVDGTPDFDTLADLSGRSTSEVETIGDMVVQNAGEETRYQTGDPVADRLYAAETALERWREGARRGILPSLDKLEDLSQVARLEQELNRQGVGPDLNVDYHTRVAEPTFNEDGSVSVRMNVEGRQTAPEGLSVLNPRGLVEQTVSDIVAAAANVPPPAADLPPRFKERVNSSTLALAQETGFSPAQVGAVLGRLAGEPSWPEDLVAATHGLLDLSGRFEKESEEHAEAAQRVFRAGRWAQELWDAMPDLMRRGEPSGPFGVGERPLRRTDWEEAYAHWAGSTTFDMSTAGESVVKNVLAAVLPAPIVSQLGKGHVVAEPATETLTSDASNTEQAVDLSNLAQTEASDADRLLKQNVTVNPDKVAELISTVVADDGSLMTAATEAAEAAARILSDIVQEHRPSIKGAKPVNLTDATQGVARWASTPVSSVAELADDPADGFEGEGIVVEDIDGLKRVWSDMPGLLLRHATPFWADKNQMRNMLPNRARRTDSFDRALTNATNTAGQRAVLRPNNTRTRVGQAGNSISIEASGNVTDLIRTITEIAPFVTVTESASSHVGTPGKGTLDEPTLEAAAAAQVLDDTIKGVDWAVVPASLGFEGIPVQQKVAGETQDAVLVTGVQFSSIMAKAQEPFLTSRGLLDPDGTVSPAIPDEAEFGEAAEAASDHIKFGNVAWRWPFNRDEEQDAPDWDNLPAPPRTPDRRSVVVVDLGREYVNATPEEASELWMLAESNPIVRSLTARIHGEVWQPPGTEQVWATEETDPAGNYVETYHRADGTEDPHTEPVFVPAYEAALLDDTGPVGPISPEQFRERLQAFEGTRTVNGVSIVGDVEFGKSNNPWKGVGQDWTVTVDVPTVIQGETPPSPGMVSVTLNKSGAVSKLSGLRKDIANAKSVFDAVGLPVAANPKIDALETP